MGLGFRGRGVGFRGQGLGFRELGKLESREIGEKTILYWRFDGLFCRSKTKIMLHQFQCGASLSILKG
jgi:hypothetical protein